MTATEFRDKKTREIQELFEKLSSLEPFARNEGPSLSHLSAPNRKTDCRSGQSRARATLFYFEAIRRLVELGLKAKGK
jgi:hypothetical protein